MTSTYRGGPKSRRPKKTGESKSVEELVRELRKKVSSGSNYRERSLKIHGLICAKCGREFDHKNRRLLTVHHKDGNPRNNPSNGSNWENLCVYCHEDEHSRGMLGDYLTEEKTDDP
jgi:5-methylcytosine-specific restriction endonuclease McrA